MSVSRHRLPYVAAALVAALSLVGGSSLAATGATKDEAVAMVKKAVAFIRPRGRPMPIRRSPIHRAGSSTATSISWSTASTAWCWPTAPTPIEVGTNQIADKDPDGKAFVKERVELAATHPSFWQTYKFMNPVTHEVEPKDDVLRAARPDGGVRRGLSALSA